MAETFKEMCNESDPFFTAEDKAAFKHSFVGALKAGISVASFVTPIVIVFAIGTMIGNFCKSE